MKRHLQCAKQQRLPSNITKHCAWHAKWLSWLIRVTYEMLFTMRRATEVTLQHHQILRLPRKVTVMIGPRHIWNVIYNARSNRCHLPTSPNTAPATKSECHDWSSSHMKRYWQCAKQQVSSSNITKYWACHEKWLSWLILVTYETSFTLRGATKVTLQHHQILRLLRTMTLMIDPGHILWNVFYNAQSNRGYPPTSPNTAPATQNSSPKFRGNFSKTAVTSFTMRDRSENDPTMIREWSENETVSPQPASQPRLLFALTTSILYWKIQHFALRLSFQISPNAAPATKSDTWTSPNTAPATKANFHDWSASHMKRYLQWAEQQVSSSNITEYWILRLPRRITLQNFAETSPKRLQRHLQCGTDPRMIRPWSENDPRMKPSVRNPPRNRGYFSRSPQALSIEKYNISRSGYHSKFHQMLHLPQKVTLELHQILRRPRKVTLELHQIVHLPGKVTLERHQKLLRFSILYSSLLLAALLYSSLLFATLLDSSLLFATLLVHSTLLFATLRYSTLLLRIYSQTNLFSGESILLRI